MTITRGRIAALLPFICALGLVASPAAAQRSIVIDAGQSNPLGSCGTDCLALSTGTGRFGISPFGSIRLFDGSDATFYVAESATRFEVLSGFTVRGDGTRIDFVDFFAAGRSLAIGSTGNREDPDFQIQLKGVDTGGLYAGLEIAFAYRNPVAGFGVPAGARIGYSGSTLGVRDVAGPVSGTFAGFPAERFAINDNGLLLGQRATDSDFSFVVGRRPDTSFTTRTALLSESFVERRAAVGAVPEPASWAMMILGFGVVGAAARQRRRPVPAKPG